MPGLRFDSRVDVVEFGEVCCIALDRCSIAADRLIQFGLMPVDAGR
jgi:hypothetical protein